MERKKKKENSSCGDAAVGVLRVAQWPCSPGGEDSCLVFFDVEDRRRGREDLQPNNMLESDLATVLNLGGPRPDRNRCTVDLTCSCRAGRALGGRPHDLEGRLKCSSLPFCQGSAFVQLLLGLG